MGLLKLFGGRDPEEYEREGDAFFDGGEFGDAKLQYEAALGKLMKKRPHDSEGAGRLREKIAKSRESLARAHTKRSRDLMELDDYDEAEDLLILAGELTEEETLQGEIDALLAEVKDHKGREIRNTLPGIEEEEQTPAVPIPEEDDDEYFRALVSVIPEDIRRAYIGYGDTFKEGYIALNRGDYDRAYELLTAAHHETGGFHIAYEIATACLNRGDLEETRNVAEGYVQVDPASFRGYHLLCEVLWEMEAFDEAQAVIDAGPAMLRRTLPMKLLEGETLARAGRYAEAERFYRDCRETHDWDAQIVQSQALVAEALGKTQEANDLYGEIMNDCRQCRVRLDPFIKLRYAETAVELGNLSSSTLELYLSLAEEIPDGRAHFFHRISDIYAAQGNEEESLRYRAFAERLEQ